MDIHDALRERRTIRAFKPDPVPKEVIAELLREACWAPSWGDSQPWEFWVFAGPVMEAVRKESLQKARDRAEPYPEIPVPNFSEAFRERSRRNTQALYDSMGIGREDREKREEYRLLGAAFFHAPVGIVITMDKALGPMSILDMGLVMENIMLGALHYNLGTAPLYVMVRYPDILRRHLEIPDSRLIVSGIALGYPDLSAPQNRFPRYRTSPEEVTRWFGFA